LDDAIDVRNKVFHGQITNRGLDRPALLQYVTNIRRWCEALSMSALNDVGYDGFQRDSFRKGRSRIAETYRHQLADLQAYKKLLKEYVERPHGNQQWQAPAVLETSTHNETSPLAANRPRAMLRRNHLPKVRRESVNSGLPNGTLGGLFI